LASTLASSSPRLEEPQDNIQSRERSETTGSRPEELQETCRRDTLTLGLESEQRETRVVIETLEGRELGEEELVGKEGEEQRHPDTNKKISNEIP
jgi:hypothetical protein